MKTTDLDAKIQRYKELRAYVDRFEEWLESMPPDPTGPAAPPGEPETGKRFGELSRLDAVVKALEEQGLSTVAGLRDYLVSQGYPIDKKAVSNALYRAEKDGRARRLGTTANQRGMWGRVSKSGPDQDDPEGG